jgi:hypothetical protein
VDVVVMNSEYVEVVLITVTLTGVETTRTVVEVVGVATIHEQASEINGIATVDKSGIS